MSGGLGSRTTAREKWLAGRCNDLAHALEEAITVIEYQGGAGLITEKLWRVFFAEDEPSYAEIEPNYAEDFGA